MRNFRMKNPGKHSVMKEVRDYVFITVGMFFYCIGWTVMLLPNNITTGGVSGIANIIYWGIGIPVNVSYFSINAVLMIFALRLLGLKFCVKTIYAVTTLTLMVSISQGLVGDMQFLHDEPFMVTVIGSIFCGMGVGMGLSAGGSTGGTDIIAAIINKYRDISLGRVIMLCDVVIISCSYFVLKSWERVMYGYVELFIVSYCVDQVVNSMRRSVQFFIISDKYEEIGHNINQNARRGCTVIDGHGFYSGKEVKMLFVLARKSQSEHIFQLISQIDPNAFVSQSAVIGVYGEGFDHFRIKASAEKENTQSPTNE